MSNEGVYRYPIRYRYDLLKLAAMCWEGLCVHVSVLLINEPLRP